ncbi:MAG: tyrosine-protein phosphatase [Acidimicrobiales bacterium]
MNGRDLGGIVTRDGQLIQRFGLLRSASPHTLTPTGWNQLADAGIRTIIDLRHDWEVTAAPTTTG